MKKIPRLRSEAEEREFWANEDSADYIDWSKAKKVVFPNLKPSLRTISLRLAELMLEELKRLADKHDVPYQSLIKLWGIAHLCGWPHILWSWTDDLKHP
jgi:predicted DNA binding CopG/RHH family protein